MCAEVKICCKAANTAITVYSHEKLQCHTVNNLIQLKLSKVHNVHFSKIQSHCQPIIILG